MNQQEILKAPTVELKSRLRVVDFSTIPHQQREATAIRSELARRISLRREG